MGEALGERTERHTGLGGMTLFLTWQSAELNSRALTRRQAPRRKGADALGRRTLLWRGSGERPRTH